VPVLETLRRELPEIVSEALACPEEPYDAELRPGDVNLRFVAELEGGLDYLIEVRTRWTRSRAENVQERSDHVRDALQGFGVENFGVWVELPEAAWSEVIP
jgi:hypothetical protein